MKFCLLQSSSLQSKSRFYFRSKKMANISGNKEEPSSAPNPNRWYNLTLGSSFKNNRPSSKFCSLRYEFKPASIDKTQPGTLHKNKDNRVSVEFNNNQVGKPKVSFEGSSEDYKENDAVLFFDGETFRLEKLHRAVKRLKHVRKPGESSAAAASTVASNSLLGQVAESYSPPTVKGAKLPSSNKGMLQSMPCEVERIDIGVSETIAAKPKGGKTVNYPSAHQNSHAIFPDPEKNGSYPSTRPSPSPTLPDLDSIEMEEELVDILNDDYDDFATTEIFNNSSEKDFHRTGIDINIPHQNDSDDEIADVDVSDDEEMKGQNAAEALRAQVNAEVKGDGAQSSSSSGSSSGSESSGSGSSSSSSSSDGASSEADDSVNSI